MDKAKETLKDDLDVFTERLLVSMETENNISESQEMLKRYYHAVSALNNFSEKNISFLLNQADERNMKIALNNLDEKGIILNQVKSYKQWQKEDVQVLKGSKSLQVYAPIQRYKIKLDAENKPIKKGRYWDYEKDENGNKIKSGISFKQVPVFNSDQTNAEELGIVKKIELSNDKGEISTELLDSFISEISDKLKIPIQQKTLSLNLGGFYVPTTHSITLNKEKTNVNKLRILFHEIGHSILHKGEESRKITMGIKENEAESVSYILSSKIGIQSDDSSIYIKSHGNSVDDVKDRLKRITQASKTVFNSIDFDKLIEKEKERLEEINDTRVKTPQNNLNQQLKKIDQLYYKNQLNEADYEDIKQKIYIAIENTDKLDYLRTDQPYWIKEDKNRDDNIAVMMALTGGTIEDIKEDGFKLFKGEIGKMKISTDLTEKDALEIVNKSKETLREEAYISIDNDIKRVVEGAKNEDIQIELHKDIEYHETITNESDIEDDREVKKNQESKYIDLSIDELQDDLNDLENILKETKKLLQFDLIDQSKLDTLITKKEEMSQALSIKLQENNQVLPSEFQALKKENKLLLSSIEEKDSEIKDFESIIDDLEKTYMERILLKNDEIEALSHEKDELKIEIDELKDEHLQTIEELENEHFQDTESFDEKIDNLLADKELEQENIVNLTKEIDQLKEIIHKSGNHEAVESISASKQHNEFNIISDSGIVEEYSNGGKSQEILLAYNNRMFNINILSESHEMQSYAKLTTLDNDNKSVYLKKVNPHRDYGIDLAHKRHYSQDAFKVIIDDFKKIIQESSQYLSKNKDVENTTMQETIQDKDETIKELQNIVKKMEVELENHDDKTVNIERDKLREEIKLLEEKHSNAIEDLEDKQFKYIEYIEIGFSDEIEILSKNIKDLVEDKELDQENITNLKKENIKLKKYINELEDYDDDEQESFEELFDEINSGIALDEVKSTNIKPLDEKELKQDKEENYIQEQ